MSDTVAGETTLTESTRSSNRTVWLTYAGIAMFRMLVGLFYGRHLPIRGDERYFLRASDWTAGWLKGEHPWHEAESIIVARGWYMPGTSFHAVPIRLFSNELSHVRLWMGFVDVTLLGVATALVAARFGRQIAVLFVIAVGLWPTAAVHSFTMWGESHGSLLLIIVLLLMLQLGDRATLWSWPPLLAHALLVGVLAGWSIYLRPPFLLQLLTIGIFAVVGLAGIHRVALSRVASFVGVSMFTALAVLAPWSLATSDKLGGRVLTTVTFDINLIEAFGDHQAVADATGRGNFVDIERYLRAQMEVTGDTYVEAIKQARSDFFSPTVDSYLSDSNRELEGYLDDESGFLEGYSDQLAALKSTTSGIGPIRLFDGLIFATNIGLWLVTVGWLVSMLIPLRAGERVELAAFALKIAIVASALQPWISNAKFRHFGAVYPLVVLLILVMGQQTLRHLATLETSGAPRSWSWRTIRVFEALAGLFAIATVARAVF